MKLFTTTLAAAVLICGAAHAGDATGIKEANLKGADLELMDNHDPASELENFMILDGYEANLFASEPMIENPIHMQWDSRGRLWVACSWSYPQLKPGQKADDKIIILEDTDNDGKADKSTIFADGLYLPTGIELANGGCYIAQSPDVFFYKDTDGDDVADVKELALTGFGIEDSHHSISAWRRGPGGWLYFQEGLFLHTQVETPRGLIRNFNGGIYQYNPRTGELRVFCSGTGGNPWGHVFDDWGQSFMVNNPKIMYISPATGNSGQNVKVESIISTTKQCGGDLARGSHIGDDLRDQLLTGRFKDRSVVRYEFIEDGAGFSAKVLAPLIASKHPNFRPVDVKMGPDGAIYVADWYNSIINHANHDFRDPRRDNGHGRIWRITKKGSPLVEKPQLVGKPIAQLIDQLGSPEAWNRHQARKELSERNPDEVLAAVEAWVEKLDPALPNHDLCLVEAMWACQNVERVSESILTKVIDAKDGHARSAGARIIRYWFPDLTDPVSMIAKLAADPFPRTRMEAVLSAGFIPEAEAFSAALNALDQPLDKSINLALSQTTTALKSHWLPAMEAGTLVFAKPSHKEYAERGSGIGFGKRLEAFLEKTSPSAEEIAEIKRQLLASGQDSEVVAVIRKITGKDRLNDEATVAMLEALKELAGTNEISRRTRKTTESLARLLKSENPTIVLLTVENLGAWKITEAENDLLTLLESSDRSEIRRAAAISLAKSGSKNFAKKLVELTASGDSATRYAATCGLVFTDLNAGVDSAIILLTENPGEEDPVPLIQTILANARGAKTFASKLSGVTLHPDVISKVAAFHRASGQLPSDIATFFKSSPATGSSLSTQLLAEDEDKLEADVVKLGDPYRGEEIYRRKALSCTGCHSVGSAGAQIGPNLATIGSSAPADYMVESILKPSAAIAEHYENTLITMKDGSARMGVISFKSNDEVILMDSAQGGKEVRLRAKDIAKEQGMPSLMPAGLADQLASRQEFLDLAKFLSVLGQPGDFSNDESPVIRKWNVISAPENDKLPDASSAWLTAYSKVSGELPAADLPAVDEVFASGTVNVLAPGDTVFKINSTKGLRLWVDGAEIKDLTAPISLTNGHHEFTFRIDRKARGAETGLRVEFTTPQGSTVKLQPEGGV
ncbi:MAG: HEAT repeat domain-containing protein [Akkermansiaceae bacterium]|nr:HEAT repeat domain-containing protein [Akkermansiaceae bacterium]MDP4647807.1 HEAT repeat domain-containing protein [Akkermansiaceae bacterium]MDP4719635.1 HEAT repeat domain-containing protein [Akkermansiaceae bacterium]MDP4780882.1 HEAT repeat domain-containing protein [Akkermansiaceae bacterium]MDP4896852.1 HEAT repeat domain-containing protein [Akkermansiaceae bacterium]